MKTLKIGRSSTNNIVINDVTVSTQHAIITILDTKEVRIKDLNSLNGTYVNGKRITTETIITAGDVIKVGSSTLDWVKYLSEKKKPSPPAFNGDVSTIKRRKTIGRETGDIVLNYSDVSSNHAQLMENLNGEIVIADSGSTNGTYVNGQKISIQTLRPGDRVLIANKYPLNWQNVFSSSVQPPTPKPKNLKTIVISAATVAVLVVGMLLYQFLKEPGGKEQEPEIWPAEKIYAYYKKSVVMIEFAYYYQINIDGARYYYGGLQQDKEGNIQPVILSQRVNPKLFGGTGTGFIVSNDGTIITNRHIVAPWNYQDENEKKEINFVKKYVEALLPRVRNISVEGTMYEEYLGIFLNGTHKSEGSKIACHVRKESGSDNIDIGVIRIDTKTLPPTVENIVDLTQAVVDDEDIKDGMSVYLMGFPFGEALANTSEGIMADHQEGKISQVGDEYYFRHNAASFGGASGSPVFNQYGQLIGVHHAGLSKIGIHGYGFAIKAKYAVELAK